MTEEAGVINVDRTTEEGTTAISPQEELRLLLQNCKTREEAQRVTAEYLKRRRDRDKGRDKAATEPSVAVIPAPGGNGSTGDAAVPAGQGPELVNGNDGSHGPRAAVNDSDDGTSDRRHKPRQEPASAATGVSGTLTEDRKGLQDDGEFGKPDTVPKEKGAVDSGAQSIVQPMPGNTTAPAEAAAAAAAEATAASRNAGAGAGARRTQPQQRQQSRRSLQPAASKGSSIHDTIAESQGPPLTDVEASDIKVASEGAVSTGETAAVAASGKAAPKLTLLANSPYANALRPGRPTATASLEAGGSIAKVARLAATVKKVGEKAHKHDTDAPAAATSTGTSSTSAADDGADGTAKRADGPLSAAAASESVEKPRILDLEAISEAAEGSESPLEGTAGTSLQKNEAVPPSTGINSQQQGRREDGTAPAVPDPAPVTSKVTTANTEANAGQSVNRASTNATTAAKLPITRGLSRASVVAGSKDARIGTRGRSSDPNSDIRAKLTDVNENFSESTSSRNDDLGSRVDRPQVGETINQSNDAKPPLDQVSSGLTGAPSATDGLSAPGNSQDVQQDVEHPGIKESTAVATATAVTNVSASSSTAAPAPRTKAPVSKRGSRVSLASLVGNKDLRGAKGPVAGKETVPPGGRVRLAVVSETATEPTAVSQQATDAHPQAGREAAEHREITDTTNVPAISPREIPKGDSAEPSPSLVGSTNHLVPTNAAGAVIGTPTPSNKAQIQREAEDSKENAGGATAAAVTNAGASSGVRATASRANATVAKRGPKVSLATLVGSKDLRAAKVAAAGEDTLLLGGRARLAVVSVTDAESKAAVQQATNAQEQIGTEVSEQGRSADTTSTSPTTPRPLPEGGPVSVSPRPLIGLESVNLAAASDEGVKSNTRRVDATVPTATSKVGVARRASKGSFLTPANIASALLVKESRRGTEQSTREQKAKDSDGRSESAVTADIEELSLEAVPISDRAAAATAVPPAIRARGADELVVADADKLSITAGSKGNYGASGRRLPSREDAASLKRSPALDDPDSLSTNAATRSAWGSQSSVATAAGVAVAAPQALLQGTTVTAAGTTPNSFQQAAQHTSISPTSPRESEATAGRVLPVGQPNAGSTLQSDVQTSAALSGVVKDEYLRAADRSNGKLQEAASAKIELPTVVVVADEGSSSLDAKRAPAPTQPQHDRQMPDAQPSTLGKLGGGARKNLRVIAGNVVASKRQNVAAKPVTVENLVSTSNNFNGTVGTKDKEENAGAPIQPTTLAAESSVEEPKNLGLQQPLPRDRVIVSSERIDQEEALKGYVTNDTLLSNSDARKAIGSDGQAKYGSTSVEPGVETAGATSNKANGAGKAADSVDGKVPAAGTRKTGRFAAAVRAASNTPAAVSEQKQQQQSSSGAKAITAETAAPRTQLVRRASRAVVRNPSTRDVTAGKEVKSIKERELQRLNSRNADMLTGMAEEPEDEQLQQRTSAEPEAPNATTGTSPGGVTADAAPKAEEPQPQASTSRAGADTASNVLHEEDEFDDAALPTSTAQQRQTQEQHGQQSTSSFDVSHASLSSSNASKAKFSLFGFLRRRKEAEAQRKLEEEKKKAEEEERRRAAEAAAKAGLSPQEELRILLRNAKSKEEAQKIAQEFLLRKKMEEEAKQKGAVKINPQMEMFMKVQQAQRLAMMEEQKVLLAARRDRENEERAKKGLPLLPPIDLDAPAPSLTVPPSAASRSSQPAKAGGKGTQPAAAGGQTLAAVLQQKKVQEQVQAQAQASTTLAAIAPTPLPPPPAPTVYLAGYTDEDLLILGNSWLDGEGIQQASGTESRASLNSISWDDFLDRLMSRRPPPAPKVSMKELTDKTLGIRPPTFFPSYSNLSTDSAFFPRDLSDLDRDTTPEVVTPLPPPKTPTPPPPPTPPPKPATPPPAPEDNLLKAIRNRLMNNMANQNAERPSEAVAANAEPDKTQGAAISDITVAQKAAAVLKKRRKKRKKREAEAAGVTGEVQVGEVTNAAEKSKTESNVAISVGQSSSSIEATVHAASSESAVAVAEAAKVTSTAAVVPGPAAGHTANVSQVAAASPAAAVTQAAAAPAAASALAAVGSPTAAVSSEKTVAAAKAEVPPKTISVSAAAVAEPAAAAVTQAAAEPAAASVPAAVGPSAAAVLPEKTVAAAKAEVPPKTISFSAAAAESLDQRPNAGAAEGKKQAKGKNDKLTKRKGMTTDDIGYEELVLGRRGKSNLKVAAEAAAVLPLIPVAAAATNALPVTDEAEAPREKVPAVTDGSLPASGRKTSATDIPHKTKHQAEKSEVLLRTDPPSSQPAETAPKPPAMAVAAAPEARAASGAAKTDGSRPVTGGQLAAVHGELTLPAASMTAASVTAAAATLDASANAVPEPAQNALAPATVDANGGSKNGGGATSLHSSQTSVTAQVSAATSQRESPRPMASATISQSSIVRVQQDSQIAAAIVPKPVTSIEMSDGSSESATRVKSGSRSAKVSFHGSIVFPEDGTVETVDETVRDKQDRVEAHNSSGEKAEAADMPATAAAQLPLSSQLTAVPQTAAIVPATASLAASVQSVREQELQVQPAKRKGLLGLFRRSKQEPLPTPIAEEPTPGPSRATQRSDAAAADEEAKQKERQQPQGVPPPVAAPINVSKQAHGAVSTVTLDDSVSGSVIDTKSRSRFSSFFGSRRNTKAGSKSEVESSKQSMEAAAAKSKNTIVIKRGDKLALVDTIKLRRMLANLDEGELTSTAAIRAGPQATIGGNVTDSGASLTNISRSIQIGKQWRAKSAEKRQERLRLQDVHKQVMDKLFSANNPFSEYRNLETDSQFFYDTKSSRASSVASMLPEVVAEPPAKPEVATAKDDEADRIAVAVVEPPKEQAEAGVIKAETITTAAAVTTDSVQAGKVAEQQQKTAKGKPEPATAVVAPKGKGGKTTQVAVPSKAAGALQAGKQRAAKAAAGKSKEQGPAKVAAAADDSKKEKGLEEGAEAKQAAVASKDVQPAVLTAVADAPSNLPAADTAVATPNGANIPGLAASAATATVVPEVPELTGSTAAASGVAAELLASSGAAQPVRSPAVPSASRAGSRKGEFDRYSDIIDSEEEEERKRIAEQQLQLEQQQAAQKLANKKPKLKKNVKEALQAKEIQEKLSTILAKSKQKQEVPAQTKATEAGATDKTAEEPLPLHTGQGTAAHVQAVNATKDPAGVEKEEKAKGKKKKKSKKRKGMATDDLDYEELVLGRRVKREAAAADLADASAVQVEKGAATSEAEGKIDTISQPPLEDSTIPEHRFELDAPLTVSVKVDSEPEVESWAVNLKVDSSPAKKSVTGELKVDLSPAKKSLAGDVVFNSSLLNKSTASDLNFDSSQARKSLAGSLKADSSPAKKSTAGDLRLESSPAKKSAAGDLNADLSPAKRSVAADAKIDLSQAEKRETTTPPILLGAATPLQHEESGPTDALPVVLSQEPSVFTTLSFDGAAAASGTPTRRSSIDAVADANAPEVVVAPHVEQLVESPAKSEPATVLPTEHANVEEGVPVQPAATASGVQDGTETPGQEVISAGLEISPVVANRPLSPDAAVPVPVSNVAAGSRKGAVRDRAAAAVGNVKRRQQPIRTTTKQLKKASVGTQPAKKIPFPGVSEEERPTGDALLQRPSTTEPMTDLVEQAAAVPSGDLEATVSGAGIELETAAANAEVGALALASVDEPTQQDATVATAAAENEPSVPVPAEQGALEEQSKATVLPKARQTASIRTKAASKRQEAKAGRKTGNKKAVRGKDTLIIAPASGKHSDSVEGAGLAIAEPLVAVAESEEAAAILPAIAEAQTGVASLDTAAATSVLPQAVKDTSDSTFVEQPAGLQTTDGNNFSVAPEALTAGGSELKAGDSSAPAAAVKPGPRDNAKVTKRRSSFFSFFGFGTSKKPPEAEPIPEATPAAEQPLAPPSHARNDVVVAEPLLPDVTEQQSTEVARQPADGETSVVAVTSGDDPVEHALDTTAASAVRPNLASEEAKGRKQKKPFKQAAARKPTTKKAAAQKGKVAVASKDVTTTDKLLEMAGSEPLADRDDAMPVVAQTAPEHGGKDATVAAALVSDQSPVVLGEAAVTAAEPEQPAAASELPVASGERARPAKKKGRPKDGQRRPSKEGRSKNAAAAKAKDVLAAAADSAAGAAAAAATAGDVKEADFADPAADGAASPSVAVAEQPPQPSVGGAGDGASDPPTSADRPDVPSADVGVEARQLAPDKPASVEPVGNKRQRKGSKERPIGGKAPGRGTKQKKAAVEASASVNECAVTLSPAAEQPRVEAEIVPVEAQPSPSAVADFAEVPPSEAGAANAIGKELPAAEALPHGAAEVNGGGTAPKASKAKRSRKSRERSREKAKAKPKPDVPVGSVEKQSELQPAATVAIEVPEVISSGSPALPAPEPAAVVPPSVLAPELQQTSAGTSDQDQPKAAMHEQQPVATQRPAKVQVRPRRATPGKKTAARSSDRAQVYAKDADVKTQPSPGGEQTKDREPSVEATASAVSPAADPSKLPGGAVVETSAAPAANATPADTSGKAGGAAVAGVAAAALGTSEATAAEGRIEPERGRSRVRRNAAAAAPKASSKSRQLVAAAGAKQLSRQQQVPSGEPQSNPASTDDVVVVQPVAEEPRPDDSTAAALAVAVDGLATAATSGEKPSTSGTIAARGKDKGSGKDAAATAAAPASRGAYGPVDRSRKGAKARSRSRSKDQGATGSRSQSIAPEAAASQAAVTAADEAGIQAAAPATPAEAAAATGSDSVVAEPGLEAAGSASQEPSTRAEPAKKAAARAAGGGSRPMGNRAAGSKKRQQQQQQQQTAHSSDHSPAAGDVMPVDPAAASSRDATVGRQSSTDRQQATGSRYAGAARAAAGAQTKAGGSSRSSSRDRSEPKANADTARHAARTKLGQSKNCAPATEPSTVAAAGESEEAVRQQKPAAGGENAAAVAEGLADVRVDETAAPAGQAVEVPSSSSSNIAGSSSTAAAAVLVETATSDDSDTKDKAKKRGGFFGGSFFKAIAALVKPKKSTQETAGSSASLISAGAPATDSYPSPQQQSRFPPIAPTPPQQPRTGSAGSRPGSTGSLRSHTSSVESLPAIVQKEESTRISSSDDGADLNASVESLRLLATGETKRGEGIGKPPTEAFERRATQQRGVTQTDDQGRDLMSPIDEVSEQKTPDPMSEEISPRAYSKDGLLPYGRSTFALSKNEEILERFLKEARRAIDEASSKAKVATTPATGVAKSDTPRASNRVDDYSLVRLAPNRRLIVGGASQKLGQLVVPEPSKFEPVNFRRAPAYPLTQQRSYPNFHFPSLVQEQERQRALMSPAALGASRTGSADSLPAVLPVDKSKRVAWADGKDAEVSPRQSWLAYEQQHDGSSPRLNGKRELNHFVTNLERIVDDSLKTIMDSYHVRNKKREEVNEVLSKPMDNFTRPILRSLP